MNLEKSTIISKCIGDIEKETGGQFFLSLEEDSFVGGVIVKGISYDSDKVLKKLATLKRKLRIKEFGHLMVGENIILIQHSGEGI